MRQRINEQDDIVTLVTLDQDDLEREWVQNKQQASQDYRCELFVNIYTVATVRSWEKFQ